MNEEVLLQRARSLMDVGRYEMALQELQKVLETNPEHATTWLLMLVCYTQLSKHHKAIELARNLLSQLPNESIIYYYLGVNLLQLEELEEAEEIALAGIQLTPHEVDLFALMGQIQLVKKDWDAALNYADQGLAIAPTHVTCLNIRVQALTKLGRKDALKNSMEETLNLDPNNPYSHSNIGWSKLESGDHEAAKHHFAEALRINPNLDDARTGLLEALKAKNIFYRGFLSWMFWTAKMTERNQWIFIIGLYMGFRFVRSLAKEYPQLLPLVFIIGFMFFLTWIMGPLFDLFIKLDKTARHALTPNESAAANVVGVGLGIGLSALLAYWISNYAYGSLLMLGMISIFLVIPGTIFYTLKDTTHEFHGKISLIGLGICGLLGGTFAFMDDFVGDYGSIAGMFIGFFFVGSLVFQFAANYWKVRARPID